MSTHFVIFYDLSQIVEKRVYEADYDDITSYFQKTKIQYHTLYCRNTTVLIFKNDS